MSNGKFTLIQNLPLDLQYYFLRGLSTDCQLFVAAACREWYNMMRGHIHVSLGGIVRQGHIELLIYVLPRIQSDRLFMRVICLICQHNQTDMLEMLHQQCRAVWIGRSSARGKRICVAHLAAIYAIRNKNAKLLQIVGAMFPHIYERDQCAWIGRIDDSCTDYTFVLLREIIDVQAISILSDVLDKPFVTQFNANDVANYARSHGKTVVYMYLRNNITHKKRLWSI